MPLFSALSYTVYWILWSPSGKCEPGGRPFRITLKGGKKIRNSKDDHCRPSNNWAVMGVMIKEGASRAFVEYPFCPRYRDSKGQPLDQFYYLNSQRIEFPELYAVLEERFETRKMEVPNSWEVQIYFSRWNVEQRMGDAQNTGPNSSFLCSKGDLHCLPVGRMKEFPVRKII